MSSPFNICQQNMFNSTNSEKIIALSKPWFNSMWRTLCRPKHWRHGSYWTLICQIQEIYFITKISYYFFLTLKNEIITWHSPSLFFKSCLLKKAWNLTVFILWCTRVGLLIDLSEDLVLWITCSSKYKGDKFHMNKIVQKSNFPTFNLNFSEALQNKHKVYSVLFLIS